MTADVAARVAIADDGELAELRSVLDSLDVSFSERGGARGEQPSLDAQILFSTPRHALALQARPRGGRGAGARQHVVVLDAASRSLGRVLERSGCDFVLRSPVHREVYRLLVERALYRGTERRRHARVAVAAPVKIRVGRRTRSGTLTQLSRRGGGLLLDAPLEPGTQICLLLPAEFAGGARLALDATVVLSGEPAADGSGARHHAVVFRDVSGETSKRLRSLLVERAASGPTLLPGVPERAGGARAAAVGAARPARAPAAPSTARRRGSGAERRRSPRAAFADRVMASGSGAARVLAGRDLSTGGMRVERHPDLAVGSEVKLALYGRPGRPAFLVRAVVARDAGRRGWILHFTGVSEKIAAQLDELVRSLPQLDAPREDGGPDLVVSEIVEAK